jgi:hypothetical protein
MMNRPRDRYGRPLADGADPAIAVPGVPERTWIASNDAWSDALTYLADDLPFHAHEVFEQRWKCAPEDERACWQALAQWGAALTHRARGNQQGARRIAQRAARGLREAGVIPEVVQVELVLESCADLQR